jgi:hypothetical protein
MVDSGTVAAQSRRAADTKERVGILEGLAYRRQLFPDEPRVDPCCSNCISTEFEV